MRQWTAALVVTFALQALAQEGEQMIPRIDLPGERSVRKQLAISDKQMDAWDLTGDDRDSVKGKVADLNKQRAELIQKLLAARESLKQAHQGLNEALNSLRAQQAELHAYIKPMLPPDKKADFDLRVGLQSIIDWLNLSDAQADQLVQARRQLITEYGGRDDNPAARLAKAATDDVTPENREQYKELVKKYMEFNQKWMAKVLEVLNEEQKKIWTTRYRRTLYTIGGGGL